VTAQARRVARPREDGEKGEVVGGVLVIAASYSQLTRTEDDELQTEDAGGLVGRVQGQGVGAGTTDAGIGDAPELDRPHH
jgi:hypothetical protein